MADVDAGVTERLPIPAAPPPEAPAAEKVMSLVDHLTELRTRLIRVLLAVAVGTVIGFIVADDVRAILVQPLPSQQVQVLGPGDAFSITLRISVIIGIILAMPMILYQLWAFIGPGLTPTERRSIRPWLPLAIVFFALGVGIAYVVLPYAIDFLLGFTDQYVTGERLAAVPYFDFVTTMFLVFGVVMEFPIVLFALARVGILSSARLASSRRIVALVIAIFAAVATPGGDPFSPLVLGGTMYLLFEGTLFFIRRTGH